MSYEEIEALLIELRADVSRKVRLNTTVLKALDGTLKALKDPTKNAVAFSEAVTALKRSGRDVLSPEIYTTITGKLTEAADHEIENAAFLFARDLRTAFDAQGVQLKGSSPQFTKEVRRSLQRI